MAALCDGGPSRWSQGHIVRSQDQGLDPQGQGQGQRPPGIPVLKLKIPPPHLAKNSRCLLSLIITVPAILDNVVVYARKLPYARTCSSNKLDYMVSKE